MKLEYDRSTKTLKLTPEGKSERDRLKEAIGGPGETFRIYDVDEQQIDESSPWEVWSVGITRS